MAELLTRQIATEYRDRALCLSPDGLQDTGKRRALRMELEARCNISELEAVNIINGYHINDYVAIAEILEKEEGEQKE